MKFREKLQQDKVLLPLILGALVIIGSTGYDYWLTVQNNALSVKASKFEAAFQDAQSNFIKAQKDKNTLTNALNAEAAQNQSFSNELNKVTTTVETLQRLTQTDPQLLYKYSKI